MSDNKIDFVKVYQRYQDMSAGHRAELRRATSPEVLTSIPGLYRLLPGIKIDTRWQQVAFFLPYAKHNPDASDLGEQLAKGVNEQRMFQVVRSGKPNDLIQLRRIFQKVEPNVNWQVLGETLYFWGKQNKQRLLENYFLHSSH